MNKTVKATVTIFLFIFALLIVIIAMITGPKYIPYEKGLIEVAKYGEGKAIEIIFHTNVANYQIKSNNQGGYNISLYTTILDDIAKNKKQLDNIILNQRGENVRNLFYVSCGEVDDFLLYGENSPLGTMRTLPSLLLVSIMRLSIIMCLVLGVLILLLFKARKARGFLQKVLLVPVSWLLSQFLITGYDASTFTPMRDLGMILCLAIIILLILFLVKKFSPNNEATGTVRNR